MLYIVQPDFPNGSLQMQDHFIWRKRKNEKNKGDLTEASMPDLSSEAIEATQEAWETENSERAEQLEANAIAAVELKQAPEAAVNEIAQVLEDFVEVEVKANSQLEGGLSETALAQTWDIPDEVKELNELDSEKSAAENEAVAEKKTAQTALVQYFLQKMKEKNIKHVDTLATAAVDEGEHIVGTEQIAPAINETANMIGSAAASSADKNKTGANNNEPAVSEEAARKIWRTVTRLARYPHFLERPYVKAIVDGKPMTFQVESKRGEKIRVKTENKMKIIKIEDISDIQIQY